MAGLTVNEIRHLFAELTAATTHTITHWLVRSRWRRLHQPRARTSHYRGHGQLPDRPAPT
ncbi:hypothetical protein ACQEVC_24435 [Plantactinospora sp. CA-294935]|uniref:hypothetical protein n=1 Tax=Plantactinospora sp. CA-294935 TaxID=3240012 RepID=UPI003D90BE6F